MHTNTVTPDSQEQRIPLCHYRMFRNISLKFHIRDYLVLNKKCFILVWSYLQFILVRGIPSCFLIRNKHKFFFSRHNYCLSVCKYMFIWLNNQRDAALSSCIYSSVQGYSTGFGFPNLAMTLWNRLTTLDSFQRIQATPTHELYLWLHLQF
jgi:hypothetical protein